MTERAEVADGRMKATRITAGVLGALLLTGGFAGIGLVAGWFEGGDRLAHRVHDLAWGGLGGLIIAAGLLAVAWRPEHGMAGLQQAALGVVAGGLGWGISGDLSSELLIPVVAVGAVIALHPQRRRILSIGRPSVPMLVLVIAGGIPLKLYALDQGAIGQVDRVSAHAKEMHWAGMAALAYGIILVALLAALRPEGWRLPAWSSGLALAVLGAASLLNPEVPSSLATPWGAIALGGAVVWILAAELIARAGQPRSPNSPTGS